MNIRKATHDDIKGMAACHCQAFPEQPMTEMGSAWLAALYRYFLEHPKGVSIVAEDERGEIVGLAVGGDTAIREEFIKKAVCRYWYLFPLKFITSAVLRKKALQRVAAKLSKPKASNPVAADVKKILEQSGVLLSIGVVEKCRGTQTASRLIQTFFEVLTEHYDTARLTVRADNTRARRFYEKNGWTLVFENEEEAKYIITKNAKESLNEDATA